jgi:rod shape determining protein RodA
MDLSRSFRDNFDWPLFVTVCAIAVIGVINLYSATSAASLYLRDVYIQQIYWLVLGAGVAVLTVAIDYRHFERQGWIAYGFGVVLLGNRRRKRNRQSNGNQRLILSIPRNRSSVSSAN